jgi:hypothetical protein
MECLYDSISEIVESDAISSCSSLELQFCNALYTCGCSACETEFESYFSCTGCDIECSGNGACDSLWEAAKQCISSTNPDCGGCFDSAYNQIFAGSDTVDCIFYETSICNAMDLCECTACQSEFEAFYSCGQTCDALDCSEDTSSSTAPTNTKSTGAIVGGVIGGILLIGGAVGAVLLLRWKKSKVERQSKVPIHAKEPSNDLSRDTHPTTGMSYSMETRQQEQFHSNSFPRMTRDSYDTEIQYPAPRPRQTAAPHSLEPNYDIQTSQSLPNLDTKDFYRDTQFHHSQPPTSSVSTGNFDYDASRSNLDSAMSCNTSSPTSDVQEFLPTYKQQCQPVLAVPMAVAVFPESSASKSSLDP